MNNLEIYLIFDHNNSEDKHNYMVFNFNKFNLRNFVTIKHNIVNGKYKSTAENVLMYLRYCVVLRTVSNFYLTFTLTCL